MFLNRRVVLITTDERACSDLLTIDRGDERYYDDMFCLFRVACLSVCACTGLFAQDSTTPLFEVASVKPASPAQNIIDFQVQPGRLRVVNLTLPEIIQGAYSIKAFQLTGVPRWVESARFNIEAKTANEASREAVMEMLRALLADRFQLRVHHEVRPGNVFELVVAGNGPKLTPSTADKSYIRLHRNTPSDMPGVSYTIGAQKASMKELADYLTGTFGRPVLDKTEVAGLYDFSVDYAIDGHAEVGPSIFTAIQEQLKLKLHPAKGSIDMLIIDSVEQPTGN